MEIERRNHRTDREARSPAPVAPQPAHQHPRDAQHPQGTRDPLLAPRQQRFLRRPPTAGFLGKYFIFLSLVETGHYTLAVIAVLYVAVALYYYFRIVVVMFMREPVDQELPSLSRGIRFALGVTFAMTLLIGLYPEPFIQVAGSTALSIMR